MALPALLLRTPKGRIITKDDALAPVLAVKTEGPGNDALIFEVREPPMGRSDVDEARILEIGTALLATGKESKGFVGISRDRATNVGVMTSRFGNRGDRWENATTEFFSQQFANKFMAMCSEMFALAKANGLVPAGRKVNGELIRFDVQYRKVANTTATEVDDRFISKTSGAHLDGMQIQPVNFAPAISGTEMDIFMKKENKIAKGIAFLVYLQSMQKWSGTELCFPAAKDPEKETITFKPTSGDVVVINEQTYHGVCNDDNLSGADRENQSRVLLRVTMPYDS